MSITQLTLDTGGVSIELPETIKQAYVVRKTFLFADVQMISGRLTREISGYVWSIDYQYGHFSDFDKERFLRACENGMRGAIECAFLVPETNESRTGRFLVTAYTPPKFMWSSEGAPVWGDYSVSLREVKPGA